MATAAPGAKSARDLYSMAKRQGTWDPEQIPLAEDRADWERLSPGQRQQLVKICSLFFEGETSVADTLPFFVAGMEEPERRMFLAAQLLEEVKHAEFFELYFRDVFGQVDTAAFLADSYRRVLVDELRERSRAIARALLEGNSEALEHAMVLGVTHYMGVVEGLMAVTGYDYFEAMLGSRGIFPRLLEGIRLIRADEGRHLTHGMEYLRTKIAQRPELAADVQRVFFEESKKIPARTEFAFQPNDFQLDQNHMLAIAYAHLEQRSREAGLVN